MLKKIVVLFFVGILAWAYKAIQPPPPKICGSPDGPPVTAARIKLSDGRHLAYIEHGVPKEMAKYKIVFVHGFDSFRHDAVVPKALSLVLICWFVLCYFYFGSLEICYFFTLVSFESMVGSSRKLLKSWGSTLCLLTDLAMGRVILIQREQ